MAGEKIAALLIAATIAVTLLNPVVGAVQDNTGTQDVDNESITASTEYQDLEGYNVDSGETVEWYNSSSGSYEEISEGSDYEIDRDSGQVKINSSGVASEGDDLRVTYSYTASSSTVTTVVGLAPLFMGLLVLGILAARVQGMM